MAEITDDVIDVHPLAPPYQHNSSEAKDARLNDEEEARAYQAKLENMKKAEEEKDRAYHAKLENAKRADEYLDHNLDKLTQCLKDFLAITVQQEIDQEMASRAVRALYRLDHYLTEWFLAAGKGELGSDECGDFVSKLSEKINLELVRLDHMDNLALLTALLCSFVSSSGKNKDAVGLYRILNLSAQIPTAFFDLENTPLAEAVVACDLEKNVELAKLFIHPFEQIRIKAAFMKLLADLWRIRNTLNNNEERNRFDRNVVALLGKVTGTGLSEKEQKQTIQERFSRVDVFYPWLQFHGGVQALENFTDILENVVSSGIVFNLKKKELYSYMPKDFASHKTYFFIKNQANRFFDWLKELFTSLLKRKPEEIEMQEIKKDPNNLSMPNRPVR